MAQHYNQSGSDIEKTSLGYYLKDIGKIPLLTAQEEYDIGMLSKKGDLYARNKLITSNLRLVVNLAVKYSKRALSSPKSIGLEDLIQAGNLGLRKTVEKFDPKRGIRFSTYASIRIKRDLTIAVENNARVIRLPKHIHTTLRIYGKAKTGLDILLGREAKIDEICNHLNITHKKYKRITSYAKNTSSIDFKPEINQYNNEVLTKAIINKNTSLDTALKNCDTRIQKGCTQNALNVLDEREQDMIQMRYGLNDNKESILQEIGDKHGVTRERARQIINRALRKIKHNVITEQLIEYS